MTTLARPPIKAPQRDLSEIFVPVLFANGEDDDLLGLVAAFEHKPVMYDGKVYQPAEGITVKDRQLRLSRPIYVVGRGGGGQPIAPSLSDDQDWVICYEGDRGRRIAICGNYIRVGP